MNCFSLSSLATGPKIEMTKKFSYKNKLAVPKLEKIIINMGVGEARENAKVLDGAVNDMTIISGQKPMITKAKKSIANFKLREGHFTCFFRDSDLFAVLDYCAQACRLAVMHIHHIGSVDGS